MSSIKEKAAMTGITVGVLALVVLMVWGGWRIKRWWNWKYGYGPKVEARIEQLEERVEKLEEMKHEH